MRGFEEGRAGARPFKGKINSLFCVIDARSGV
jgi:hypothetical protein